MLNKIIMQKLNTEPACIEYDDNGRVTHVKISNIQGGCRCKIDLEYDENEKIIKIVDSNNINPATTKYEYDECGRIIKAVESKRGYDDIVTVYEYEDDYVTKTLTHRDYKHIVKTDKYNNVIYSMYEHNDGSINCTSYDIDYNTKIAKQKDIYKKDGRTVRNQEHIFEIADESLI